MVPKISWVEMPLPMEQEHFLDVTGLEAPEPLQIALAALESLPHGHYLRLLVRRDPIFLYPLLLMQGFEHETRSSSQEHYEVLIWHKGDQDAATAAHDKTLLSST